MPYLSYDALPQLRPALLLRAAAHPALGWPWLIDRIRRQTCSFQGPLILSSSSRSSPDPVMINAQPAAVLPAVPGSPSRRLLVITTIKLQHPERVLRQGPALSTRSSQGLHHVLETERPTPDPPVGFCEILCISYSVPYSRGLKEAP